MLRQTDLLNEWKEHGSVWKSKSGKYGSKNKRGRVKYFKEESKAREHAESGGTPSSANSLPIVRKVLGTPKPRPKDWARGMDDINPKGYEFDKKPWDED